MKRSLLRTASLLLGCLIILSGCSTADNSQTASISSEDADISGNDVQLVEAEEEIADSGEIARNENLVLEWDSERAALLLKDNNGGVWGSLPYTQYDTRELGGGAKRAVESHIAISYIEPDTLIVKNKNSYTGAFEDGRLYSKRIDNGIRITYYFDDVGIVIPVEYTLIDDALQVKVDVKGIHEDIYKLLQISVFPFGASAPNSKDNYLFIPDGSGMLAYCGQEKGVNTFWCPIYDRDPVCVEEIKRRNTAAARLPVFGVKSGEYALCGIITEGEGAAEINASTGDSDITYSNVYATFSVRGSDAVKIPDLFGKKQSIAKYSEKLETDALTVRYYPLSPKKQAYSEMADCYRNYLIKEKSLTKQNNDQSLYYDIPMAAKMRKFYFGFPNDVTTAVTKYKDVESILNQTLADNQIKPVVRLSGIQKGGIDIGKIGDGFQFENAVGNEKERKQLFSYAEKNGILLFPDFDIVRFQKGSLNFNSFSAAKTPTTTTAYQYFYNIATKNQNTELYRYTLLSPSKLKPAYDKVAELLGKKKISALSLSTLGNTAYSDYSDSKYYLRNGFSDIVQEIQNSAEKSEIKLMYEQPNAYAAVGADFIISSPTTTSDFYGQGEKIPFYQMVFKGYIPMSTMAVNLQDDSEKEILTAAATGLGLLYTVCGSDTLDFVSSPYTALSAGKYDGIKDKIQTSVKRLQAVFEATKNAQITDYICLGNNVYQTQFDNGTKVTVNYSQRSYQNGGVKIAPMDFYFEIGGETK